MATIEIKPDNDVSDVWWLTWVERREVIGRIILDTNNRWQIVPEGPHWSPMKSFAARRFQTPGMAAEEARRYFEGR